MHQPLLHYKNIYRQLYDELGLSGLKLLENPANVNPLTLLKNFQANDMRIKVIYNFKIVIG